MYAILEYTSSLANVLDSCGDGTKPQNKYSLDTFGWQYCYEDAL